jgi:hypothetical protein
MDVNELAFLVFPGSLFYLIFHIREIGKHRGPHISLESHLDG